MEMRRIATLRENVISALESDLEGRRGNTIPLKSFLEFEKLPKSRIVFQLKQFLRRVLFLASKCD